PALVAHLGLRWTPVGGRTLRVCDVSDPTAATVDLEVADDGRVTRCSADRPRKVGSGSMVTLWSGVYVGEREWDGLRVPAAVEVSWLSPHGSFVYFHGEITSLTAVR